MPGQTRYDEIRLDRPELFVSGGEQSIEILTDAESASPDVGHVIYEDEFITLIKDRVRLPNGAIGTYIRLIPPGSIDGAAVLPLIDDRVVLLRHFRHATRAWHWEIPRGFSSAEDLSAEDVARRELHEELGVHALSLQHLGYLHSNTGLSSDRTELFLARINRIGELDPAEGIKEAAAFERGNVKGMIENGEITDSFTQAACLQALLKGFLL